jgi:hypothetical protein
MSWENYQDIDIAERSEVFSPTLTNPSGSIWLRQKILHFSDSQDISALFARCAEVSMCSSSSISMYVKWGRVFTLIWAASFLIAALWGMFWIRRFELHWLLKSRA